MICKHCESEFSSTRSNQRFCCAKCKWTWTNANRKLAPNVRFTCEACGVPVEKYVSPSAYKKNAFRFCSHTCRRGSRSKLGMSPIAQLRPVRIPQPKAVKPRVVPCRWCGSEFFRKNVGRVFCSPLCRSRAADAVRDKQKKYTYGRTYRVKNRENYNAISRAHYRRDPTKWFQSRDRYRARKLNAPVNDFTELQWREIKDQHDNCCVYCGVKTESLTKDHAVPLSRGGPHTASNIVPACKSCNSRKWNRTPEEFLNVGN